jgi:predicted glutamine amidotransferase
MCGLVGAAGKLGSNEERMFKRLLEFDTVRGPHSTGVLFVSSAGATEVIKRVGTPWDFYQFKAVDEKFRLFHSVLMGHNRWATQGKINNTNAHPFEIDTIIGAHNGTLTTRYQLDDHAKFDVDSENIFHHMENHGIQETTPKLNGAFALTWWDKKDRSLNFIRNDQRPLFYVFSDDKKSLFWASEVWMLTVAAHHAVVKLGKIEELPIGVHYRFDVPLGPLATAKEFDKPVAVKCELYTPPVYNTGTYYGGNKVNEPFPRKPALVTPRPESKAVGTVTDIVSRLEGKERPRIVSGNASFMEYQKRMNKNVAFTVQCAATAANQKYIQCYAIDDERISIRCYPGEGTALWKKLLGSTMAFKGMVKSFTSNGGMHLTIDLRSIMEDPKATALMSGDEELDDADFPVLLEGYKGELLTPAEFKKATENGCAWCKQDTCLEEADDIVFVGPSEFICPDCKDFTDVADYIKQTEGK